MAPAMLDRIVHRLEVNEQDMDVDRILQEEGIAASLGGDAVRTEKWKAHLLRRTGGTRERQLDPERGETPQDKQRTFIFENGQRCTFTGTANTVATHER